MSIIQSSLSAISSTCLASLQRLDQHANESERRAPERTLICAAARGIVKVKQGLLCAMSRSLLRTLGTYRVDARVLLVLQLVQVFVRNLNVHLCRSVTFAVHDRQLNSPQADE